MNPAKSSLLLSAALLSSAFAQTAAKPKTATTAPKTAVKTTAAAAPASLLNPKGAPVVHGIPKTLYALKYVDIKIGDGPLAEDQKFYTVHYTGWLPDGTKFDSSLDHPGAEPFVFPYGAHRVIIGWDTGFEGMHIGGKRRLIVPWELAYGAKGRGPIPAKSPLIFDVEFIAQSDTPPAPKEAPAPPPAPKPVPQPQEVKPESTTPPPASTTQPQATTPPSR